MSFFCIAKYKTIAAKNWLESYEIPRPDQCCTAVCLRAVVSCQKLLKRGDISRRLVLGESDNSQAATGADGRTNGQRTLAGFCHSAAMHCIAWLGLPWRVGGPFRKAKYLAGSMPSNMVHMHTTIPSTTIVYYTYIHINMRGIIASQHTRYQNNDNADNDGLD